MKTNFKKAFLGGAATLLLCFSSHADLTVTITPGYQYSTSERPTTSTLNRLGQPTATITGTIGGTNANLAANSLNGTHMVDTFAGSNLTWDANSPRQLVIANSGVSSNSIAALAVNTAKLDNLAVTSGKLAVSSVDSTNVINGTLIANDLATNWMNGLAVKATATLQTTNSDYLLLSTWDTTNMVRVPVSGIQSAGYTSSEIVIAAGNLLNAAHGLATTPGYVRGVVVCQTANNGFSVGDEADLMSVRQYTSSDDFRIWGMGGNTTNVWLTLSTVTSLQIFNKTNGAAGTFTTTDWKVKVYARP